MINFKDRVPTQPNRRKITPESGSPYYVTIEYADNPSESGTALNKVLFNDIQKQLLIGDNCVTVFNVDGSITQTYGTLYIMTTTFPSSTQVIEQIKQQSNNVVIGTKTTTFNANGSISEVIS